MLLLILLFTITIFILYVAYVRSGDKSWDPNISVSGKVVIVTGSNAGLGFHTALDLARRGARVILACRDETRGTAAQDAIRAATGNNNVFFKKLDLASLSSVRKFAANIVETETQLDVLVNNAAQYGYADKTTEDGIVTVMQINYFGHFLLTLLLLPLLKKSHPSRIINLSSNLHFFGDFNRKRINSPGYYYTFFVYCNSKFCMLLFTIELSRRLQGTGVVANAVHPGVIYTNLTTAETYSVSNVLFWIWCRIYGMTLEQGAQTVVYLAAAKECEKLSGKYYVNFSSRIKSWKTYNRRKASDLWEYSEKLVGYNKSLMN